MSGGSEEKAFSAALEAAVAALAPSADPLDAADFDEVAYVNRLFPDASSLGQLEAVMERLRANMARTDEEILRQVARQSLASAKGKRELGEAQQAVVALMAEIRQIRAKAARSEQMVEEVCRDIRSLDTAKRNLTLSITTLKRLNMLVTGVSQLRSMAAKRQYPQVGSLLLAVSSLSPCFDEFGHIPKIAEAKQHFLALQEECKDLVYSEFESLDHHAPTPPYFGDLCVVIEALGRATRLQFMSWFVKDRLLDYEQTFAEGSEASRIENIKMRFQWLRRELQFYQEHFENTFPPSWEMPQLLCEEFCLVTKERLGGKEGGGVGILGEMKRAGTLTVRTLIDTMKVTIAFEKELNSRFAGNGKRPGGAAEGDMVSSVASSSSASQDHEAALAEQNAKSNPFSPEALRLKWKRFQEEKSGAAAGSLSGAPVVQCTRFTRIISDAYEPYLDIYVDFEEAELTKTMSKIQKNDEFEERNMVLESSQIMFDQFREVMDTCTSLSRGNAFIKIAQLFRKQLQQYGDHLLSKLPRSLDGVVKLRDGDEKTICFVINTAEYSASNVEALATTVKQHMDPTLVDKVDSMAAEQDRFQTVVARGMLALVRALETKIVLSAFAKMQKQSWCDQDAVVAESEYVGLLELQLRDTAIYHKYLSKQRWGFFCDSFANSFIPRFREAIMQLRVDDVGAEQLLLDVAHVKSIMDGLPKQGASDRVPSRYKRIVSKEIAKLERILKVLLTPADGGVIVASYLELLGGKGSAAELGKILDMKSIPRNQHSTLIDVFESKVVELRKKAEKTETIE